VTWRDNRQLRMVSRAFWQVLMTRQNFTPTPAPLWPDPHGRERDFKWQQPSIVECPPLDPVRPEASATVCVIS